MRNILRHHNDCKTFGLLSLNILFLLQLATNILARVAIRPVFTGTVPFLGLGPGVPHSLPLCPGIFYSKFAFVNAVC